MFVVKIARICLSRALISPRGARFVRPRSGNGGKTMRRILRRSIVAALAMAAVGTVGAHPALSDGIPPPPAPQVQPPAPPPPPAYRPAPPVVQEYVYPPPVVYAYPPPPPVVTYTPPAQVVVVPRPYYWGGYRPAFRVGGPFIAHGYGRPWGPGFRHW